MPGGRGAPCFQSPGLGVQLAVGVARRSLSPPTLPSGASLAGELTHIGSADAVTVPQPTMRTIRLWDLKHVEPGRATRCPGGA